MNHYLILLFLLILIFSFTSGRTLNTYFDDPEDEPNSISNSIDYFPDHPKRSALPSNTPQSRQQMLDLLRKAYNQGWRPNIKHYIPGTRFGRHHR